MQKSIGNDRQKLAQLDSISIRIKSIQKLIAELQTVYSVPERSTLLQKGKQEMDALRREINATQSIDRIALDRERNNLSDLQSLIQSLQQLFTVTGIKPKLGRIWQITAHRGLWEYANLGQTPVTPEPIELATFLEEIKTALLLPPNFKIEVHPTDLCMTASKSHLRKVLEELLENAHKHHDALPEVSQDRDRGQIGICVELAGAQIEFVITDDGPGIEREHHQRVFRLFETLKPRDVQENTGIGLAIVKKLVAVGFEEVFR